MMWQKYALDAALLSWARCSRNEKTDLGQNTPGRFLIELDDFPLVYSENTCDRSMAQSSKTFTFIVSLAVPKSFAA